MLLHAAQLTGHFRPVAQQVLELIVLLIRNVDATQLSGSQLPAQVHAVQLVGLLVILLVGPRHIGGIDHQHLPAQVQKEPRRHESAAAGLIGQAYLMAREMTLHVTGQRFTIGRHGHALMLTQIGAQVNPPALFCGCPCRCTIAERK